MTITRLSWEQYLDEHTKVFNAQHKSANDSLEEFLNAKGQSLDRLAATMRSLRIPEYCEELDFDLGPERHGPLQRHGDIYVGILDKSLACALNYPSPANLLKLPNQNFRLKFEFDFPMNGRLRVCLERETLHAYCTSDQWFQRIVDLSSQGGAAARLAI